MILAPISILETVNVVKIFNFEMHCNLFKIPSKTSNWADKLSKPVTAVWTGLNGKLLWKFPEKCNLTSALFLAFLNELVDQSV